MHIYMYMQIGFPVDNLILKENTICILYNKQLKLNEINHICISVVVGFFLEFFNKKVDRNKNMIVDSFS